MEWMTIGRSAPTSLTETRVQLHYGALVLASAAHSVLPKADDDSHTNLGIDSSLRSLDTRGLGGSPEATVQLDIPGFELVVRAGSSAERMPLDGQTIPAALSWLSGRLTACTGSTVAVTRREYPDFPESPIMAGASFHRPELEQLEEIAHWFANGRALLETLRADWGTMSELRVWPHHFDLGALLPIDGDKMLGIGLSPGDQTYEQPYFYCSPYPQPASHDGLPPLQVGKWHTDGFVSAVLTGEMLQGADQAAVASAYLAEAVRACRELVG